MGMYGTARIRVKYCVHNFPFKALYTVNRQSLKDKVYMGMHEGGVHKWDILGEVTQSSACLMGGGIQNPFCLIEGVGTNSILNF